MESPFVRSYYVIVYMNLTCQAIHFNVILNEFSLNSNLHFQPSLISWAIVKFETCFRIFICLNGVLVRQTYRQKAGAKLKDSIAK